MLSKTKLEDLYLRKGHSLKVIGHLLKVSQNQVKYWMTKHKIPTRTISEAIYLKNNPTGDPFCFKPPKTLQEAILFGKGIGLYWGEGTKANKTSVRLGNTDPELLRTFIDFLCRFFSIDKKDLRFSIQIFSDMPKTYVEKFWLQQLSISRRQLYKTIVTKSGSIGTYRQKAKYGVVTIYYHNKKLRDMLVSLLPLADNQVV